MQSPRPDPPHPSGFPPWHLGARPSQQLPGLGDTPVPVTLWSSGLVTATQHTVGAEPTRQVWGASVGVSSCLQPWGGVALRVGIVATSMHPRTLVFLLLQGFRVRWQWISLVIHVVEHKKNVFSVSSVLQLLNDNTEESHLLIPTSLYSGLCQLGHQPLCIWAL